MENKELIAKAIEARSLSYSPYSHFAVGAAVVLKDGSVYVGANVENASYPCCCCAERNAVYNALMHGAKTDDFLALAVVADTDEPCSPCGLCRQVLSELLPADAPIVMANLKGDTKVSSMRELLPFAFDGEALQ